MNIKDLVLKNRSYRRFEESNCISKEELMECIDAARVSSSARNAQPLKYYMVNTKEENEKVFENLAWAGYLKDWDGPAPGERPSAYIIMVNDNLISQNSALDMGIAAQSIGLCAVEKGYGMCMIGSFKKAEIEKVIHLDNRRYSIGLVLALGKPIENIKLVDMQNDDIKYYRDEEMTHYVPKRSLEEVILNFDTLN